MGEMTVYDGPAFEESVSAITLTPSVDLGSRRVWKGEEYVYAYNAGGSSIIAEYGVKVVTGASGYSVAGTLPTDTGGLFCGLIKHATMVTAAYGWVMTRGYSAFNTGNSVLTGEYVRVGGAVGVAGKGIALGLASGPLTNTKIGLALDVNTASGGSGYAFIQTGL